MPKSGIGAAVVSLAAVVGTLALAEVLLRVQQQAGPFVRLSGFPQNEQLSNRFHHRRGATDSAVQTTWHPASAPDGARVVTILFLGDSWLESGGIVSGFIDAIAPGLPEDVQLKLVNGGTTSFSPSLIMLQGELLISEHAPDLVVVNIDETDVMDEFVRYRPTAVFDVDGQLLTVPPDGYHAAYSAGLVALEEQPLYILRLAEKVYFQRVLMPRLRRALQARGLAADPAYELLLGPQLSDDPQREFGEELSYFGDRLQEMIARLGRATCDGCVLITHHPHLPQLEAVGGAYNNVVGDTLAAVADRKGVGYFDAADAIDAMYGEDYPQFFKWPQDKFSHLTAAGYRRYGAAIAAHFDGQIRTAWSAAD